MERGLAFVLALLCTVALVRFGGFAPVQSDAAQAAKSAQAPRVAIYEVGKRPRAIATADFNRDGHLDVAVANSGDGTVTVLVGDGSGRLRRDTSLAAGREPSDIDAVDLDRDGDIDLVIADHETPHVIVFLNNGEGRFVLSPASPFDTGARPHVHGLATGDFDGDGWVDIAVESADTKEVRLLRGGPNGFYLAIGIPAATMPYFRLGVGDVTGDQGPDIIVPGHSDSTVRAIHSQDGRFRLAEWTIRLASKPWMVVAADLNADRRDDIVVIETDSFSVWLAKGCGYVPMRRSPFAMRGATEAAVGDLDGDGVAEVAVAPWDGNEVTILVAKTSALHRMRMCERPIGLAIADLDRDGRGELLATCATSNQLAVASGIFRR